jgi:hypothetical protein
MKLNVKEAGELVQKGIDISKAEVVDDNGNPVIIEVLKQTAPVEKSMTVGAIPPTEKKEADSIWKKLFEVKQTKSASVWNDEVNTGSFYATQLADVWAMIKESPIVSKLWEIPMAQSTLNIPCMSWSGIILTHPNGSGHSGLKTAYEVQDDYVQLSLTTKYALVNVADETLEDVEAFTTILPTMMVSELTQKIEADTVAALLAASGRVNVARAANNAVSATDVYNLYASFEQGGGVKRPAFLVHPLRLGSLLALRDTFAGVGSAGILTQIAGIPVIPTPYMAAPASGVSGDLMLVALDKVALGSKSNGAKIQINPYINSPQNLVEIKATLRADVAPISNAGFTRSGFTSSWYVSLGAV